VIVSKDRFATEKPNARRRCLRARIGQKQRSHLNIPISDGGRIVAAGEDESCSAEHT
jgi:hypothetical protein